MTIGSLDLTTLPAIIAATMMGHPIRVAYSGDTVIDPANWSAGSVAAAWFRVVSELRSKHPDEPLYWLLISSGYRTYRYLPCSRQTLLSLP